MTQEQKAKAYDNALERARKLKEDPQGVFYEYSPKEGDTICDYIFPELNGEENEEERIRKEIITHCRNTRCVTEESAERIAKWIAWLEKQGEQKTADEVEPKFHKGEWITNGDYTWKIVEVKPLYYILQSQDGNIIVDDTISHADEHFHSFTIKDAKEGDVLTYKNDNIEWILIYKDIITESCDVPHDVLKYHALFTGTVFYDSGCAGMISENYALCFTPATKEQRDALEWAMSIDGYKWNKEKLKLEKI